MQVYETGSEWAAQMLRDILVSNGITAHVQLGLSPYRVSNSTVHIEDPADEARAREIVAGFDEEAGEHPADPRSVWHWRCPNCGEDVEPQFTECWNCQTPKPAT